MIVGMVLILATIIVPLIVIKLKYFNSPKSDQATGVAGNISNLSPINSLSYIPSGQIQGIDNSKKRFYLKELIKSIIKILVTSALVFVIIIFISMVFSFGAVKSIYIQTFFGNQENYNKAVEKETIYDQSSLGDYQKCDKLELKEKQFCLWLASEKSLDTKICDNMNSTIYPTDSMYSQESCYINMAVEKNDYSVCDRVSDKNSCKSVFTRMDAQRKICGPLFGKDKTPRSSDCYDYAVAQKTKTACDGLVAAGGSNWKEECDISAGLVSTSSLSIVPVKVDDCVMTKVAKVGNEVKGGVDSGSSIEYLNGVKQLSEEKIPQIDSSQVGDIVQLCLRSLPDCKRLKSAGSFYGVNNISRGAVWTLADSIKKCD